MSAQLRLAMLASYTAASQLASRRAQLRNNAQARSTLQGTMIRAAIFAARPFVRRRTRIEVRWRTRSRSSLDERDK